MNQLLLRNVFFTVLASVGVWASAQSGIIDVPSSSSGYSSEELYVIPPKGMETCFARRYDEAHLIKNKRQYPTYLEVMIRNMPYDGMSFEIAAEVRDIKTGYEIDEDAHWANQGSCAVANWKEPAISCKSEHGSVFNLATRETHVTLTIPRGKALAFSEEQFNKRLVLSGNDEDNRSFWLFPIDCGSLLYIVP